MGLRYEKTLLPTEPIFETSSKILWAVSGFGYYPLLYVVRMCREDVT